MARRNIPAGLIPSGFQVISTSIATGLDSTTIVADKLIVSVEAQSVRFRADGTDPAASTGVLLTAANSPYVLDNFNKTSDVKFIEAASGAIVHIQGLTYTD